MESFMLFPGFRPTGKARKADSTRTTKPWAWLRRAFGEGLGARKVSIAPERLKILVVFVYSLL